MNTPISHTCLFPVAFSVALLFSTVAFAQKDTVEFKFIPKYYPAGDTEFIPLPPPEIAYSPEILYPDDPGLHSNGADVWVNALVNREGVITEAEVFKSSDDAFNQYAIEYARQFRFKWSRGWPDGLKDRKNVWISIPIRFKR